MKSLYFCFSLFLAQVVFAQNINHNLVLASVESEIFKKEFTICKAENNLILFDKTNLVDTISNFKVCNVQINVSHDSAYNKVKNISNYDYRETKDLIILYNIVKARKYYTVYLWRPYTGANLEIKFKIRRKKLRLVEYRVSTF